MNKNILAPLIGSFEEGKRGNGPICRSVSDHGAYCVPSRGVSVLIGEHYVLHVTGTTRDERLRFVRTEKVADFIKRNRQKVLDIIHQALKTKNLLKGETGYRGGTRGIWAVLTLEDKEFVFQRGQNDRQDFAVYQRQSWSDIWEFEVSLSDFPELKKIFLEQEDLLQKEKEERKKQEEKNKKESEEKERLRVEQIKKDAEIIETFFKEHPEAKGWFQTSDLLWTEVAEKAVEKGLARFIKEEQSGFYSSFSKEITWYKQTYALRVGGKEVEVVVEVSDDDD